MTFRTVLKSTLRTQHDILLGLASRYAIVHYEIERLRSEYRTFLAKYRQDFKDPFVSKTATNSKTPPLQAVMPQTFQPVSNLFGSRQAQLFAVPTTKLYQ